jgi:hypothetical protein
VATLSSGVDLLRQSGPEHLVLDLEVLDLPDQVGMVGMGHPEQQGVDEAAHSSMVGSGMALSPRTQFLHIGYHPNPAFPALARSRFVSTSGSEVCAHELKQALVNNFESALVSGPRN